MRKIGGTARWIDLGLGNEQGLFLNFSNASLISFLKKLLRLFSYHLKGLQMLHQLEFYNE